MIISRQLAAAVLLGLGLLPATGSATAAAGPARQLLEFVEHEASAELGTAIHAVAKRELPEPGWPADCSLQLRFPAGPGQYLPTALEARVDGRLVASLPLGSYVDFELQAGLLPEGLRRGELLQLSGIAWSELRLAPGQEVVTPAAQVTGLMARSLIAPGERLKLSRLTAPPLVRRGQDVPLELQAGGVRLTVHGTALSDAYAGQALSVRRAGDGRVWRGIVTSGDSGIVVVVQ
jgi:flagella basal body P-ring formation protein FlgA